MLELTPETMNMASAESLPQPTLRIIDANLNRLSEGLRVLEDLARLGLSNTVLTRKLKTMRHELIEGDLAFYKQLIQARDSESDVGVNVEAPGQEKPKELPIVVSANARRAQQSLRALEELAKTQGFTPRLNPEKFKKARFALYSLERDLLSRLLRRDKIKQIRGLQVIIDTQALKGRSHIAVATALIRGGAKTLQLRDKLLSKKELLLIAQQLKDLCAGHDVLFIMNDYLDLALAANADGLHLGQNDLPVKAARKLLPIDKILGCSTTTVDQAAKAEADGADYIAVGSMYPSPSKETAIVVGLKQLRQVRQAVSSPIVAIGGITQDNVTEVIAAGANSVAVISAVLGAKSPEEAARKLVARIETKHE
jgi:thiamine-phosphate pyrophosphorylase